MFKFKGTLLLTLLVLNFSLSLHAYAGDNSCRIMAGAQDDVWVIVYDADAEGDRGPIIWKGKIEAGQSIPITSTDGHIRYDYTLDPNQPYDGHLSRWCNGQNTILMD